MHECLTSSITLTGVDVLFLDNKPQCYKINDEIQNSVLIVENKTVVYICGLKKYHICLNSDIRVHNA